MNNIQPGRPGVSPWTAGLDIDDFHGSIPHLVKAAGGCFWAPRHDQAGLRQVEKAHELGVKVYVWTPDSEADLRRSLEMGVDGIITNRPDRVRAIVR